MKRSFISISSDNATVEIGIPDFHASTETFDPSIKYIRSHKNFRFFFAVIIFPNGFGEDTEDWLVLRPMFNAHSVMKYIEDFMHLSCTVSIIDIEGNSRFPRCFEKLPSEYRREKYLKKSFILNKAEEFLPDGMLTLRVDFSFDLKNVSSLYMNRNDLNSLFRIMQIDPIKTFMKEAIVVDYTCRILTLPQFHEARKRFGVYGIPPETSFLDSQSEEDRANVLEHAWIIDTESDRYFIAFDERQDSLGALLLKASPVINRMVQTPMREQREKRIAFPYVRNRTFELVLDFLILGKLIVKVHNDIVDLYEFSHIYEMEELQRKCAEFMAKSFELEDLDRIVEHYPDKYLSELLKLRRCEHEALELPTFITDNIPYYECYI